VKRFFSQLGLSQEISFVRLSVDAVSGDGECTLPAGSTIVELQPFLELIRLNVKEFDEIIDTELSQPFQIFKCAVDEEVFQGFDAMFLWSVVRALSVECIAPAVWVHDLMLISANAAMIGASVVREVTE
jgi:hypothetical protein